MHVAVAAARTGARRAAPGAALGACRTRRSCSSAIVLLALVLVPGVGRTVNGSTRWIGVGGFNVQPSEFAKLAFVLYLARDVVRRAETDPGRAVRCRSSRSRCWWRSRCCCSWSPITARSSVLCATAFAMLFLAGVPLARFAALAGDRPPLGALATAVLLHKEYVLLRLTSFTRSRSPTRSAAASSSPRP